MRIFTNAVLCLSLFIFSCENPSTAQKNQQIQSAYSHSIGDCLSNTFLEKTSSFPDIKTEFNQDSVIINSL